MGYRTTQKIHNESWMAESTEEVCNILNLQGIKPKWPWGWCPAVYFPVKNAKIKKTHVKAYVGENLKKEEHSSISGGTAKCYGNSGNQNGVPQKFSDRSTWEPRTNLTGAWPATFSFHLMACYSDFLIGLWLCSCLSDSQAVLCSYTLFWGTSSHWDLFIPSNPSKLGDF